MLCHRESIGEDLSTHPLHSDIQPSTSALGVEADATAGVGRGIGSNCRGCEEVGADVEVDALFCGDGDA